MSAKERIEGAAAESSRFAWPRAADDRDAASRSSLARIRTCACGSRSRERRRPPLSGLRQLAEAPPTGLLRQVPSRTQPAAASTAPSRSGSADTGAARRCPRPDGQGWAAVSRQPLCHGGSADECAVPQSLASPTSGQVLVLRVALLKSDGLTGTAATSAFSRRLEDRRHVEYTKRSFGQRGKGANIDSRPGGSPAISTKREAS